MAAIPLLETRSFLGTRKMVSLPFSDCVPVLGQDLEYYIELYRRVRDSRGDDYKAITIRTDRPLFETPAPAPWIRHELELGDWKTPIIDQLPSGLRRNVRKAERSALTFDARRDWEAMSKFYRLHLLTRRKLGVPVQPKSFFRRLHEKLIEQDLGFVGVVSQDGRTLAAGVFLTYKDTMIYKYGASDPSALAMRPNDFLFYRVLQMACEQGIRRFDFGISFRNDEGLRRFKRKWGACETDVYHEHIAGGGATTVEISTALRIISIGIRNSPPLVCRAIGELLYRYSQ